MSKFLTTLGRNIWWARKDARLTQKQLAQKVGISTTCMSMFECGKRSPKAELVAHIASILDVPLTDIMPEYEEEVVMDDNQTTIFEVLDEKGDNDED